MSKEDFTAPAPELSGPKPPDGQKSLNHVAERAKDLVAMFKQQPANLDSLKELIERQLQTQHSLRNTAKALMFCNPRAFPMTHYPKDASYRGKDIPGFSGENFLHVDANIWPHAIRNNTLALHAELAELLEWLPWKPWKTYDNYKITHSSDHYKNTMLIPVSDVENAKLEVVDALCFLINLWLLLGGTSEELAAYHAAKSDVNVTRQKIGY